MLLLADIRGQTRAVELLGRAAQQQRLAQAYLFCGPPGVGKWTTGLALAAAVNCLTAPGVGCHTCESCHKIANAKHPDVQTLVPEGAAKIVPIATIRKRVIPALSGPPHEGRCRFFLIEEANSLLGPAANALLKTLEEPPRETYFILGTTAPERLLPTIRSRCQRINFAALSEELKAKIHHSNSDDGDSGDAAAALKERIDILERAVAGTDTASLLSAAQRVAADREQIQPSLRGLAQRLHRAATAAALTNNVARAAALGQQVTRVIETEAAISIHNAHGQLAIERLVGELRRVYIPQ